MATTFQPLQKKIRHLLFLLVHYRLLGITILLAASGIATLVIVTGPSAEPAVQSEKAWPVSIVAVAPTTASPTLLAFGKVESRQVAILKTSISAPVLTVLAAEGTWVEKGDLLVVLNDNELQLALTMATAEYKRRYAQLQAARTELNLAATLTPHHQQLKALVEAKLKRHLDLFNRKMASDAILDEVRRELSERTMILARHMAQGELLPSVIEQHEASVAEGAALVSRAELDLAQTRIIAPFQGRVIKTFIAAGDRVLPGTAVIQVADYSGIEVRAAVPASVGYALRQRFDEGVKVIASGTLDNRRIDFQLTRLAGDVKLGQSGLDAFFRPAEGEPLDIGRVVNLNITLPEEQNVIALPVQSLYENNRIYRVDGDRLQGIEVIQVGDHIDTDGHYQVLVRSEFINPGDHYITTQLPRAMDGLLVDPVNLESFDDALAVQGIGSE
jgi:multidrug efflux pump subunit AcrA (membrane-fusion protein)